MGGVNLDRTILTRKRRHNHSKSTKFNVWVEVLEPRVLLAVDPIISEFQAINNSTLQDSDGQFEDWIEIGNRNDGPIDLEGWYLTDDDSNLTKWRFPAITISKHDEIIVFASGKDRIDGASELHTNFRLAGGGEYLALVKPDGTTIVQDFGSEFPEQFEDQSYGLSFERETVPLFDNTANIRMHVPTDDSLGLNWTQIEFNDAAWLSGNMGVGYEVLAAGITELEEFDSTLGDTWTVDVPNGSASTVDVSDGSLRFSVPTGETATFVSRGLAPIVHRPLPGGMPDDFEIVTHVTQSSTDRGSSGIAVVDGRTGLPAIWLDYSSGLIFQLTTAGQSQGTAASFGANSYFLRLVRDGRAKTWTGYFKLTAGEEWKQVAVAKDGINGVPTIDDARAGLMVQSPTSTMNAQFSSFELIVPEERPVYAAQTNLDVESQLHGVNGSAYMRIPFTVDGDPARFNEMDMVTSFDDGFRAYLNGVEIAAENVPFQGAWNSIASSEFGAVNGRIPVKTLNVVDFLDALQAGDNVLAVHGMNAAMADRDFYFDASMTAGEIQSSPQFFIDPTPGETNSLAAAPQPELIAKQGVFFGSTVIELVLPEPSEDLEIRYTLDGNDPKPDSELYTGPITLTDSAMLQAQTFGTSDETSLAPSNPASGTFFALAEELRDRDSDIPIMILDTIGQNLPSSGSTSLASTNVVFFDVDRATGRATIENGIVDYLGRGGVRDRGSSTANQPKPNMTFETWGPTGTTKDDDFDATLGDFAPESDWVLHAPYNFDRALIRNQFTYAISNEVGRWSPGTRAVEVYFNRSRRSGVIDEGDYAGVYVLTEKIKQGKDRVDIASFTPGSTTEPDITGGYIWKIDRADPDCGQFNAGGQGSMNWVYPKCPRSRGAGDDQKASRDQERWVQNYFNEFRDALSNEETRNLHNPDGYAKYLDILSAVDHGLLNVLTFNVDALRLSAYLFKDRGGKIEYGPLWDCDRCMESTDGRDDNPLIWGDNFFTFLWWRDMFRDPHFWQAYVDRWTEHRNDKLSNAGIDSILDRLAAEVAESSSRNIAKWRQNPRSSGPFASGKLDGTWEGEVEHLREWLHVRADFMDSNFASPPSVFVGDAFVPANAKGFRVEPGTQISIAGPVGDVFDDTLLVSSAAETIVKYFVPTDDALGESWTQVDFDDSAWQSGPTGVGYGTSDSFLENIRTRVEPKQVQEGATTILQRYEFELSDIADIDQELLVLRMKYDDGFVAYLNGTELDRINIRDADLSWNSRARSHRNAEAVRFKDFDFSDFRHLLTPGKNVLSIRGINSSGTSTDMLMLPELVTRIVRVAPNPIGQVYYTTDGTDPRGLDQLPTASAILSKPGDTFTVTENVRITARNFDDVTDRGRTSNIVGTDWSGLTTYDVVVSDSPLVISEINYNPLPPTEAELQAIPELTDDDFEFVEVYNPTSSPVNLIGTEFSDGIEFDFYQSPDSELGAGERILVVHNQNAFALRYGDQPIAGEFAGNLSNGSEDLDLIDGTGTVIFSVNYNDADPWPIRADGHGSSLVLIDPDNTPVNQSSKHYRWRASREVGGSPGTAGQDPVGVVINEIIANTQGVANLNDSIELFNPTTEPIAIGGWFLSDSANDFFKFQIPAGTVLDAGQYVVYDEQNFNPTPDVQAANHFGLSGDQGDSVWLIIPDGESVGAFVDDVHFRETATGVSLGRLPNGSGRLAPLAENTLGADNGDHLGSSLVITELNYNPGKPSESTLAITPVLPDDDLEFVEIRNTGDVAADLTNWRLRGGIDYNFADNTMLESGEMVVVVKFNPENPDNVNRLLGFRTHYDIDESVRVIGGYAGQFNNSDDRVVLLRPGVAPDDRPDFIPRVQADEVLYDDLAPWPVGADGTGHSLQRLDATAFGNDAQSWFAGPATPGGVSTSAPGDFDGNGIIDARDIDSLSEQLRSNNPDVAFDLTGDAIVDAADRDMLVKGILGTNYGDQNLDGKFGTDDLVQVFRIGEYEDGIELNSTWAEGDWDGNGDFESGDLTFVFQAGGFIAAAHASELNLNGLVIAGETIPNDHRVDPNGPMIEPAIQRGRPPKKLLIHEATDSIFTDGDPSEDNELVTDELFAALLDE